MKRRTIGVCGWMGLVVGVLHFCTSGCDSESQHGEQTAKQQMKSMLYTLLHASEQRQTKLRLREGVFPFTEKVVAEVFGITDPGEVQIYQDPWGRPYQVSVTEAPGGGYEVAILCVGRNGRFEHFRNDDFKGASTLF